MSRGGSAGGLDGRPHGRGELQPGMWVVCRRQRYEGRHRPVGCAGVARARPAHRRAGRGRRGVGDDRKARRRHGHKRPHAELRRSRRNARRRRHPRRPRRRLSRSTDRADAHHARAAALRQLEPDARIPAVGRDLHGRRRTGRTQRARRTVSPEQSGHLHG